MKIRYSAMAYRKIQISVQMLFMKKILLLVWRLICSMRTFSDHPNSNKWKHDYVFIILWQQEEIEYIVMNTVFCYRSMYVEGAVY